MSEVVYIHKPEDDIDVIRSRVEHSLDIIEEEFGYRVAVEQIQIADKPIGVKGIIRRACSSLNPSLAGSSLSGEWIGPENKLVIYRGPSNQIRTTDRHLIPHELGHGLHEQRGGGSWTSMVPSEAIADMVRFIVTEGGDPRKLFQDILVKSEGTLFDGHAEFEEIDFSNHQKRDAALLYYIYKTHGEATLWKVVGKIRDISPSNIISFFHSMIIPLDRLRNYRTSQLDEFNIFMMDLLELSSIKELNTIALDWYDRSKEEVDP